MYASSSLVSTYVLIIKNSNRSLPLCVDYHGLDKGTIKNTYPLPLLYKALLCLQKAKYFMKLNIRDIYNLLYIVEGKEWKTAFQTCYGLSESLVIPFGLTNTPANFQHFINNVLCLYVDIFVIANIENILIDSDNVKDYQSDIDKVLKAISNASLYLKLEMYRFYY
jgi:hypothetical protein